MKAVASWSLTSKISDWARKGWKCKRRIYKGMGLHWGLSFGMRLEKTIAGVESIEAQWEFEVGTQRRLEHGEVI